MSTGYGENATSERPFASLCRALRTPDQGTRYLNGVISQILGTKRCYAQVVALSKYNDGHTFDLKIPDDSTEQKSKVARLMNFTPRRPMQMLTPEFKQRLFKLCFDLNTFKDQLHLKLGRGDIPRYRQSENGEYISRKLVGNLRHRNLLKISDKYGYVDLDVWFCDMKRKRWSFDPRPEDVWEAIVLNDKQRLQLHVVIDPARYHNGRCENVITESGAVDIKSDA